MYYLFSTAHSTPQTDFPAAANSLPGISSVENETPCDRSSVVPLSRATVSRTHEVENAMRLLEKVLEYEYKWIIRSN